MTDEQIAQRTNPLRSITKAMHLPGGGRGAAAILVVVSTGLFVLLTELGPLPYGFGIAGDGQFGWLRVGYFIAVCSCGMVVSLRGWKVAAYLPALSACVLSLWVARFAPSWQPHPPGWHLEARFVGYPVPAAYLNARIAVGVFLVALLLVVPLVILQSMQRPLANQPRFRDTRLAALATCVAFVASLLARLWMPITTGFVDASWREPAAFFTSGLAFLLGASRVRGQEVGSRLVNLTIVALLSYPALNDLLYYADDTSSVDLTRSYAQLLTYIFTYLLGVLYASQSLSKQSPETQDLTG